ncbi:MAG: hypothetical protein ABGX16_22640 [Pirellulales bacterium]
MRNSECRKRNLHELGKTSLESGENTDLIVASCHPEGEGTETCFGLRLKDLLVDHGDSSVAKAPSE